MRLTHTALLLTAFTAAALLAACSSTGPTDGGVDVTVPGLHIGGHFHTGPDGKKTVDVDSQPAKCIEVCFSGSAGEDLGCETIELPGSAQVPAGAVRWEASVVDCPKPEQAPQPAGVKKSAAQAPSGVKPAAGGQLAKQPVPLKRWDLFGAPITPIADGTTNVSYALRISAPSLDAADLLRDLVLSGGTGAAVGGNIQVLYYNESEAEFDQLGLPTGVRMRQAVANDSFVTLGLTVNGASLAELGVTPNVLEYQTPAGWDVAEVFVPASDFDTSPSGFNNSATVSWTTQRSPAPHSATQYVVGL